MRITGIYKRKAKYDVYLEHEYAFSLTDEGLYRLKLSVGMDFNPDEQTNRILREDEVIQCKHRAMSMVSMTPKSVKQLEEKLSGEGFSHEAIAQALSFMKEYSFTDDVELAKSLVRSGVRKHQSKHRIRQRLFEKGIAKSDATAVLEEIEIDEYESAYEVALKKYRSLSHQPKEKILNKIGYALSYRAFSYDASRNAIQKIRKLIEQESEFEE